MVFSLREIFDDIPVVRVVDVGASPIDGTPIYEPLRESNGADVVGFEPAPGECERLNEAAARRPAGSGQRPAQGLGRLPRGARITTAGRSYGRVPK